VKTTCVESLTGHARGWFYTSVDDVHSSMATCGPESMPDLKACERALIEQGTQSTKLKIIQRRIKQLEKAAK
jgi:hypothetical protein